MFGPFHTNFSQPYNLNPNPQYLGPQNGVQLPSQQQSQQHYNIRNIGQSMWQQQPQQPQQNNYIQQYSQGPVQQQWNYPQQNQQQQPQIHQAYRQKKTDSENSNGDSNSPSNSSNSTDNNDHWHNNLNIKNERVDFSTPNCRIVHPGDQGSEQYFIGNNVSIPGIQFDAKTRSFSEDELRPQPIIRKRKKVGFS